jgi:hypothetical protein
MTVQTQLDLPEVKRAYDELNNYFVKLQPRRFRRGRPRCIVYFSSNGIFYPNSSDEVLNTIFRDDRYEWRRNIPRSADKAIFLRDVKKQWYLEGINNRINSIEGVLSLLQQATTGYDVVCVGSSAGGYAAMLFGCLLGAQRVVSFSGQFSLDAIAANHQVQNPLLVKYHTNPEVRRFYSVVPLLRSSRVQVFHLYPKSVRDDEQQVKLVAGIDNVIAFPFRYGGHGVPCYLVNCIDIMTMQVADLMKISRAISECGISPLMFSLKSSGVVKTLYYLAAEFAKSGGWKFQGRSFMRGFALRAKGSHS